jgi:hypothetical protein
VLAGQMDAMCPSVPPCGLDGTCDGLGNCHFTAAGTACSSPMCSMGVATPASTCNGAGACAPGMPQGCGNYLCSGPGCGSSCAVDGDCIPAAFCQAAACVTKLGPGAACSGNNQCASGACTDGVCCNSACAGTCMACTAAKKGYGTDGQCGAVALNLDPDNDCSSKPNMPCDDTGVCDGMGACKKASNGTVCAPASCNGNTATPASTCNGTGTCVAGAPSNCMNGCSNGVCTGPCAMDSDCGAAGYCDAQGQCAPKKGNGVVCALPHECLSASCADGVCCDALCNGGACQACSAAKGAVMDGACTPLNGAPCTDGNKCTDDVCQASQCASTPVMCTAPDPCHVPGTCDPQSGACSAATAKDCAPPDGCHAAGSCDPVSGACVPGTAKTCTATDVCHMAGACDPVSGVCSETAVMCPASSVGPCEIAICDPAAMGCVGRSRLDGAPCELDGGLGICLAGRCFAGGAAGTDGGGGATGSGEGTGTGSTGTVTGGSGDSGAGGREPFHFAGGACSARGEGGAGEAWAAWGLAVGIFCAARRRARRDRDDA